jgi:hypothetical protein
VQISAEMFHLVHDPSAQKNTHPTLIRLETTFNEYVNPGASAIWDPACSQIHGLTAGSPEIQATDGIGMVWRCFCDWVNKHFADNDTGILVAYNGETCDLAWQWKLTQAPRSTLSFTDRLKFFLDQRK